ncbi:MAG: WYL domain-containing protein [Treponema sp.]|nr:WYL domain-containing protein [Treponema sp.]
METRKNLPRAILSRIYYIDRQIASGKYPNVHDLAKGYEVGTATIYRDIEYLRDMLNAPIEYDAKNRGWYYKKKSFRLPARFASADDMLALGMAKALISLYKNTPLYESAKRLLDDITAPLSSDEAEDIKKSAWYEDRIIVPPVASAKVQPDTWEQIVDAMKENRVITFEYKGLWDEDYKTRLVRPFQLVFDNGVWHVYGYSEERSAIRFFSLSRIKNVTLTNERFALPKDFDYCRTHNSSFFGVFAGQKKLKFRIAFYDESALWVRERQWAEDQKIDEKDDGVVICFTSTQYAKVLEWVLSRGCTAQPLKPDILVTDWQKQIKEMKKLAKI